MIDLPKLLALLILIAQGVLVVGLLAAATPLRRRLFTTLRQRGVAIAFVVTLGSMVGSLALSEVAGLAPCDLCWYQRMAMYPQVLVLGLALLKKNPTARLQSLVFSVIGAVIAIYHIFLQLGVQGIVPCSIRALAVPCNQVNFIAFGYVTIPVMSLTAFVLIILALLFKPRSEPEPVP